MARSSINSSPQTIRPDLVDTLLQIQPLTNGIPRSQVQVPISPVPAVTDQVLFESPTDPTKKFYVPAYILGQQNVSGLEQFRIVLEQRGQGGDLSLYLNKIVPPQLQDQVTKTQASEIDHTFISTSVFLQYHLTGSLSSVQKVLPFQELTDENGVLHATLNISTLDELYQVYQAMTNPAFNATLTVRRTVTVAIPLPSAPTIASSNTGVLRGTWLFNFDSGSEVSGNADVWWDQQTDTIRSMNPQGRARIVNLGVTNFDAITPEQLRGLSYSSTPIPANNDASNQLVNNDVFAVLTNTGNYAKVQVLNYGYNLTLRWVTYRFAADSPVITRFNPNQFITATTNIVSQPHLRPRNGDGDPPPERPVVPHPPVIPPHPPVLPPPVVVPAPPPFVPPPPPVPTPVEQAPLFGVVTRALDDTIDPNPFVFPTPSYVFRNVTTGSGSSLGITPVTVTWNGRSYNYYQDQAQLYTFYYLPDSFKIGRATASPHYPLMQVQFTSPDGTLDNMQATLIYCALPYVDSKRISAAAKSLTLPPDLTLPPNITGPQLKPLAIGPNAITFQLALPGATHIPGVQRVDLQSGIFDALTMSLADFRTLYDELFSGTLTLFRGNVVVNLGSDQNKLEEQIPFTAQMNDLVGPILDQKESPDSASKGLQVTIQNAIESPIQINSLKAELQNDQTSVPGIIQQLNLDVPIVLNPKETKTFIVAPASPIDNASLTAVLDLSGIAVLPTKDTVWNVVLDPSVIPTYTQPITVETIPDVFQPQNPDTKTIYAIVVDFQMGRSVKLSPDQFTDKTGIHLSIGDYVLGHTNLGQYLYRVNIIRKGGNQMDDHWTSTSTTDLFPNIGS